MTAFAVIPGKRTSHITVERTTDIELVTTVLRSVYRYIGDDATPPIDCFHAPDHPAVFHLLARDGDEILGIITTIPENFVCWQVHVSMSPDANLVKGRFDTVARQFIGWVWQNTVCQRLVAHVPACNRLALQFAKRAGMRQYGNNEMSFLKHGKLWDQIDLGLSRGWR